MTSGQSAILASAVMLVLFIGVFLFFLISTIYDTMGRGPLAVIIFVIANIALIIVLFGNMYRWSGLTCTLANCDNNSPFVNSIYFSTITWTTVGYGDFVPSQDARPIAAVEALIGYVVMALIIAVLLALVQSDQARNVADLLDAVKKYTEKQRL